MATADPSDESSTSGAGPDNATTGPAKTGAAAEASTDPDDSNSDTDPAGAGDAALDDAEQDEVDAADAIADELDEMTEEEAVESEAVTAEEEEGVLAGGAADTAGSDDDVADPDGAPVDVGTEGQVSPGVDLDSPVGDVESDGAAAVPTADTAGSGYGSQPAEQGPAESEVDTQTASELQPEPDLTDAAAGGDGDQPATAARSTVTALRQQAAPEATTVVDTLDASVDPAPQSVTTGLAGLVSKFLGLLGIGPSAGDTGVPLPSFEFVTAVFGAIRREMDRLFSNDGPSAAPVLTGQAGAGVLTGSLGATDPEGDPLRYSVVQAPGLGAVTVDADGDFVYTAGPDLAAAGGTDTFVVRVRDTGFRLLSAGPRTTEVPVTVTVAAAEADSGESSAAAAPTAMLLAAAQATSTGSGSVYQVSASGPDIVGFDPAKDKLDLGDVSVHNFIVVDTAEGVGFRNPWSGETAIIQGVSLGQLTVDSFTPIINDHLRQDLSGALAWEHGVTAAPGTVYARSHEIGQIDRVAFDAATDVVDFRYYGTREQLYMTDTPEGVVISNAGTGQALILQGVTTAQLTATNFIFHNAQVREDRLHLQLGIGTVPNSQVLPQGVPIAGTDNWPTAAGNGAPPSGQTGTTTTIAWQYGTHTTLEFDPAADTLDFGWFKAHEFTVDEVSGSTRIAIVNNNQSYTLTGVGLGELEMSNIVALDDTARAKWQTLISHAAPPVSRPTVSVGDASAAEGDSDSTTLTFTVTLSEPAGEPVTVSYSTANGTATAAGADYTPTVGTLTFAAGETVKTVNVAVTGDTMVELDEQFTLNLSAPVNAVIGDGVGVATIVNDDVDTAPSTPPAVSIADLTVAEGDGEHSHFMFTVTLDKASDETVTVQYSTSDGTAIAGVDYTATTGTVTFAPGVTTQLVHVDVIGDAAAESNETFTVTLSSPVGATLADGSAIGTITDDDTVTTVPGLNSGNPGDELWGEAFYAPYVDMGLWPVPDLVAIAQGRGASLVTLGFLQATPDGKLAWAGLSALAPDSDFEQAQAINSSIAALQAAGGDVMISLGGASGTSLAQWYATRGLSARSLADAYVAVAQTYSLNRIDFDIEGAAVADAASIALRSQALALMQQDLPDLEVWYTLPVLPTGLTSDGLNVVRSAVSAGVELDGVNVMAMDYGESAAPTSGPNAKTMGAYAIQAAESTYAQLAALYGEFGQSFGWNQVGVTPMIGVNDVTTEVFTVADAQALEDFARAKGLGMLSMWSVARDTPGSLGQASPTASGLDLPAGSFSAVFNDYGTANDVGDTLPTLSISDAAVVEGDGGQTHVMFTVTLSAASDEAVSVGYVTSNGTATAGVDYTAGNGTITFAPGVLSQQISVTVTGDGTAETDETFTLTLSSPSGVTVADGSATGTIVNDDVINPANLMLSISDASVVEGAPGSGVAPGWFSTSGNQIVDSAGNPVQIAGINWFGMESDIFTPHGLWTRNYQDMMDQMVALEFNTIRLPYSSEMLHTTKMPSGIDFYRNPELAGLTPIEIMDEVIRYAGEVGLRVILDHHRSSAGAGATANGLWYEGQYTEAQWIADWQMLAARYAGDPTVIGADLHNEPHNGTWGGGGATDWAAAAERAGNAILAVNDNWLIFVEGVATYEGQHYWWGGNLMGVADRPIVLDVADRVVYSPHDYPNSVYAQPWFQGADFGDALPDKFEQMWGYIYEQNIAPIYLGEFGTRLSDPKDVVWYEAITSYLSGDFDNDGTIDIAAGTQDMSWTFWSWNPNSTDTGGILADDWNTVNENKLVYLEALQFDFDEDTSGVLANFVVTLAQPSNQTVTVQYATSNGTATGGDDYVATTGTLTFAPGETSKTISVVVLGDTVAEGSESFLVTLSSPTGATVGDGTGTGTITDATVV
ncbi:Calx-beta domain-containing protein [Mycolicibacterium poriferae]|uniref:Calx-beta domain-containing protein n=1 Tax=Mycolicibacterium poriferae TaxID=39694 RepID=UPI00321BB6DF